MIYHLDTDTFVFMIRGLKPGKKAPERQRAQRIASACEDHQKAGDTVGLSAIVVAELEFGTTGSDDYDVELETVREALTPFDLFAFDAVDCPLHFGKVRYDLKIAGTPIGPLDVLIAAHALALDATLVTNNVKDFRRVKGLRVVNWSTP